MASPNKPSLTIKILLRVVALVLVTTMLLRFDGVAKPVADMFNTTIEKVKNVAATVFWSAVGVLLIVIGIAAISALPIVGVTLALVGIGTLAFAFWPYINKPTLG